MEARFAKSYGKLTPALFLYNPPKLDAGETPNSKSVPTGISKLRVTKFAPSTKA